ncbi:protease synthase and sporulation protein PAI 2 [Antarctobacter heliothermus]|uniref:Protease synthase and sporulation protein PAI 2 n=1 Tax=Antarctobacter heliothermus TaxID=74033 RepID=A0A222DZG7_9RHOB|nr:FMN-binding negative transcriptional regulator [Antarctobacter heliothermus]ASP19347.1 protease synthase and sporulation protein PAI 2 [Antarctobacter heliothermus]
MHPNQTFRRTDKGVALSFARDRTFGTLAVSTQGAPLISHVPFLLAEDGTTADLHLVRSNPIARVCGNATPVTLAVTGPDAYISPDWYGIDDQVPTWNYVAVHLVGMLRPLPVDDLPDLLARQSAAYEARLPGKAPWTMDKMSAETMAKFLRMILPFRLEIAEVQSTYKLGQNKDDTARQAAADMVETGLGSELGHLARLMRHPPDAE